MAKSKKHGIGLCKQNLIIDPTRTILNTITVFVDDPATLTNVDAEIDSKKYKWTPRQTINVVSLSDGGTPPVTAAVVHITAYCLGRKTGHTFTDTDDDLIVTLYYNDGSGGTETDVCTFTDVEYDSTSALTISAINHRPALTKEKRSPADTSAERDGERQRA